MSTWIVIIAVGLGSFLFRFGPLAASTAMSATAERAASLAATAALAGLVVTALSHHESSGRPGETLAVLVAAGVAAVVVRLGRPLPTVLVAGMGAYWILLAAAAAM